MGTGTLAGGRMEARRKAELEAERKRLRKQAQLMKSGKGAGENMTTAAPQPKLSDEELREQERHAYWHSIRPRPLAEVIPNAPLDVPQDLWDSLALTKSGDK